MKKLLIASSLALATFAASADGPTLESLPSKASTLTRAQVRAETLVAMARGEISHGDLDQVEQADGPSRKSTGAAPMPNCGGLAVLLNWKGITIPNGAES